MNITTPTIVLFLFWAQTAPGNPAVSGSPAVEKPAPHAADIEFYEKRVRPVLLARCLECHAHDSKDGKEPRGGLVLDRRDAILAGGDSGAAAVPGDPAKSLIISAIGYRNPDLQMPPAGKMPDTEIAILEEWVQRGLPHTPAELLARSRSKIDIAAGRQHWAFLPLSVPSVPLGSADPAETRLDAFVLDALTRHQLAPASRAPRAVLARRLKLDLTGIPPSFEEIEAFASGEAPDAWDRLVDRYLASPQLGERWARMWLDYARYCDVPESWREGDSRAWLYRDWVIAAINGDMSYREFIRRQIAADLLPDARPDDVVALGFLGLSPTYWKELKLDHKVIKQVVAEEWEERIEALGATFLGLTIACARCHDHKYDPITTQDYYALAGVFANSRLEDRPVISPDLAQVAFQARAAVKELEKQIDAWNKKKDLSPEERSQREEADCQIVDLKATPHYSTPLAYAVSEARMRVMPDGENRTKIEYDAGEASDIEMHIRGNAANPGPTVPRRFLTVLSRNPNARFEQGSGRLELANAIVEDAGPLATRVAVNRIWKQMLGRGLVTSPSNFGFQGDRPTHPELLDELAARFQHHDWSVKRLLREIALSETYQRSSYRDPARFQVDPDNVWLWRAIPRRLDVESWRDSILVATGELNGRIGGEPEELADNANVRRTVYGRVKRRELSDILRLHDFPDPVAHSPNRVPTTTPLQQLFALNGPFVAHRSRVLATSVLAEQLPSDAARIQHLYRMVFARRPTSDESTAAIEYLLAVRADGVALTEAWRLYIQVLLGSNEFLFVD